MRTLKKVTILFSILLVIFTSLSGCLFDDILPNNSDFTLISTEIIDDEGFPSVKINYSVTGKVGFKMLNPDSKVVDYDYFYNEGVAFLKLSDYRDNIKSGKYILKTYDSDGKKLQENSFSFSSYNVEHIKNNQMYWDKNDETYLSGIQIMLLNHGKAPIYPKRLDIDIGSNIYSFDVLPTVISPGQAGYVECFTNIVIEEDYDDFFVYLLDSDSDVIYNGIFQIDMEEMIDSLNFHKGLSGPIFVPKLNFINTYYKSLERIKESDYSVYIFDRYDDLFIDFIIEEIIDTLPFGMISYNEKSNEEKINFLSSFVQHLDYKSDRVGNDSYEYARYPLETIFNEGGDCEDKAILTCAILSQLGFNVSLLRFNEHMAVGVKLKEDEVSDYDHYINDYFYLETTSEGKPLGFVPNDYRSTIPMDIYPVYPRPLIFHEWKDDVIAIYSNSEIGTEIKVIAIIQNYGAVEAEDLVLEAFFYLDYGLELNNKETVVSSVKPYSKEKVLLTLSLPKKYKPWFKTRIYLNGQLVDEQQSASKFN